jgi:hypothetical protein
MAEVEVKNGEVEVEFGSSVDIDPCYTSYGVSMFRVLKM